MILYPQLDHGVSQHLANTRRSMSIAELQGLAAPDHAQAVFTPTGGTRATPEDLAALRDTIVAVATRAGFPSSTDGEAHRVFDREIGKTLVESMSIQPAEASKQGVWNFMSCVLACDLVRWRWLSGDAESAPLDRFMSGRRNTFQRLWWRTFVLRGSGARPHELIDELGEDEVVQIMERPFLAGSRTFSVACAKSLLKTAGESRISRRVLIREAQKRFRRLASFVSFEAIAAEQVESLVDEVFADVAKRAK